MKERHQYLRVSTVIFKDCCYLLMYDSLLDAKNRISGMYDILAILLDAGHPVLCSRCRRLSIIALGLSTFYLFFFFHLFCIYSHACCRCCCCMYIHFFQVFLCHLSQGEVKGVRLKAMSHD